MALELIKISEFPQVTEPGEWIVVSGPDGVAYKISKEDFKEWLGTVTVITDKPIALADPAPTMDGVYLPTESGTYTNAGGLVYDPEGADAGKYVQFIKNGSTWTKLAVDLPTVDTSNLISRSEVDVKEGANIFNKAEAVDNSYVDDDGVIQTNAEYSRSKPIYLDPTKSKLYIKRNSLVLIAGVIFNESGVKIQTINNNTSLELEIDLVAGFSYFIGNISNTAATRQADKDEYMVSQSPIVQYEPYEAFFAGIGDVKLNPDIVEKTDIESSSANLFNRSASIVGTYYDRVTGDLLESGNFVRSELIPIDRSRLTGDKIYINRNSSPYTNGGAFYGSAGLDDFKGGITFVSGETLYEVDVPVDAEYIGVNVSGTYAQREEDLSSFMLSYEKLPYLPYKSVVTSIKGIKTGIKESVDFNFYPFSDGMNKRITKEVAFSVLDIQLYGQTVRDIYLKQFGRYYNVSGTRRWYFEIWDANGLAYGGKNSTGRWDLEDDFKGVETFDLFDQDGAIVGEATVDWSSAWPDNGGVYIDGTMTNAKLDTSIFVSGSPQKTVHPLQGLRVIGLGDSIMEATNSYLVRTANEAGMILVQNNGIGGSTIAQKSSDPAGRSPMVIRFSSMDDNADLVIVAGGTNDCNYSWTPFGDFTDRTPNTFLGALHILCEGLLKKYPIKRILFMTPIKRNQDLTTPEATNAYGKTQQDYADAIIDVCGYWGIPVLDMFREGILNPFIPEIRATYFDAVGTHPLPEGQQVMANRLTGYLRQL